MQKKGYVSFVLHAHLPFIYHPESDDYLEESWLYEAISETYIPLLQSFQKLVDEGVNFKITMSITPTLLSMLDNKLLQNKYINYLKKMIELSEKEIERTKYDKRVNDLSHYYYNRYSNDLHLFRNVWNCDFITWAMLQTPILYAHLNIYVCFFLGVFLYYLKCTLLL